MLKTLDSSSNPTRAARLGRALGSSVRTVGIGLSHLRTWLANQRRRLLQRRLPDYVVFTLAQPVAERAPVEPRWYALLPGRKPALSLEFLAAALRRVADDPDVRGVVLLIEEPALSLARAQNLVLILERFRTWDAAANGTGGKEILLYAEQLSAPVYLVACAADRVVTPPLANWTVTGFQAAPVYLKESLARLGIRFDVVKIAPWKTAADSVSRASMSDAERNQYGWLLDSLMRDVVDSISRGRKLAPDTVTALIDRAPLTAAAAQAAGLVDAIAYEDELPVLLGQTDEPATLKEYRRAKRLLFRRVRPHHPRSVGVISLTGTIVTGASRQFPVPLPIAGESTIGSTSAQQVIRAARADDRLAAVVLHVDSGGGSALASDLIWRELVLLNQSKPLIVYMGNVAASGGYYLSAPGRKIVAQSATLTGSIGVITAKAVLEDAYAKVDAHQEVVRRGANAGLYQSNEAWTDEQRAMVEAEVREIYHIFKERVAAGRGLDFDALDGLANGRVWTGAQAQALGLVDELGDFETAVTLACTAAELPTDGSVRTIPVTTDSETRLAAPAEVIQAMAGVTQWQQTGTLLRALATGDLQEAFSRDHIWLLADGLPRIR